MPIKHARRRTMSWRRRGRIIHSRIPRGALIHKFYCVKCRKIFYTDEYKSTTVDGRPALKTKHGHCDTPSYKIIGEKSRQPWM